MPDPALSWLAAAFIVTWLIIGIYLVRLARAQRKINERLDQLPKDQTPPPV